MSGVAETVGVSQRRGMAGRELVMQVDEARRRIGALAMELDADHPVLASSLLLVMRASKFDRACQMRLLSAGASAIEAVEVCLKGE